MSDQPGIPAITVFPPFTPAARQADPAPAPAAEQAPPATEPAPSAPAEAAQWDAPVPAQPMPWDFEAAAPEAEPQGEPSSGDDAGAPAAGPVSDDEEDLPWLEVPAPRADADDAAPELKADDEPSWMDWVRDAGPQPDAEGDAGAGAESGSDATPIADLAPEDAQPWSPETETAADDWSAPTGGAGESWEAPSAEAEPAEPEGEFELPEPELYDLPSVTPADSPWADTAASAAAGNEAAEPAWELPSQAAPDAPPAWDAFAPTAEPAEAAAPADAAAAASPSADAGPFAAVADRLQGIADVLRADPGAFLAGAQGGGDPLALLVAGFVLGYQARQGGGS